MRIEARVLKYFLISELPDHVGQKAGDVRRFERAGEGRAEGEPPTVQESVQRRKPPR